VRRSTLKIRHTHPRQITPPAIAMISSNSFSDTLDSSRPASLRAIRATTATQEAVHDAELVRRFNDGDEDAFVEIVARYRGKMFSIALRHLRDTADAEEITQDVFMRAYRGLARFRGESSLSSWLHCIAFNLSRNRYWYFFRRHRHETCSFDSALSDDSNATVADLFASNVPDPAREALNSEFSAQVTICMEKLSVRQREILTMRNQLNHSYEEIANILGLSLGTVKSRIARARENLRALLSQKYAEGKSDASPSSLWFEPRRVSGHLNVACG
jgi:RNA polymerase sigma-70 factor (ECF subfamily)